MPFFPDYIKIKESVKEFLKDFKKNLIPNLAIAITVFIIAFSLGKYSDIPNLNEKNQANIGQQVIQMSSSAMNAPNEEFESCKDEGMFAENLESWRIPSSYNRIDEEGFYCPRKSSNFLSPDIWYKNLIPTNFDSLEIRYKLKNRNNTITTAPSFIFSIGENPRILRLYIPERDNYLVGCEKNKATAFGSEFSREDLPYSLNEPIEWQEDAEVKVRITINKGNEARFDVNLNYLSALDGKPTEEYISYNVVLSDPNPVSELSKIAIGFATLKDNCIKPISYKFCY